MDKYKTHGSVRTTTTDSNKEYLKTLKAQMTRAEANVNSSPIATIPAGSFVEIISKSGTWCRTASGWLNLKTEDEELCELITQENNPDIYDTLQSYLIDKESSNTESSSNNNDPDYGFGDLEDNQLNKGNADASAFLLNARGIHAMPYQFNSLTDRRCSIESSNGDSNISTFGRSYTKHILSKMPILLLSPGRPQFMSGYNKNDRGNILKSLGDMASGNKSMFDELMETLEDGRFFSFKYAFDEYYEALNPILNRMAMLLGIGAVEMDGTRLDNYRWQNYTNDEVTNFMSSKKIVPFYMDQSSTSNEGFNNSTGPSFLKGMTDSASDMSNELQFILGNGAASDFVSGFADPNNLKEANSFVDKYLGIFPETFLKKLLGNGATAVLGGGKLIFPEIWKDSDFMKSYDISIKLRTPDADPLSWFLNIGVPLMSLVCMAAPQMINPNAYNSPFLVRAYHKGFFNCDMGIITSLDIRKGVEGKWTTAGLPMVVDISINLKDLYQDMSITTSSGWGDFLANTSLLDYIANMCGVNINEPDAVRGIWMYYKYFENEVRDLVTFNGFIGVENALTNIISSVLRKTY